MFHIQYTSCDLCMLGLDAHRNGFQRERLLIRLAGIHLGLLKLWDLWLTSVIVQAGTSSQRKRVNFQRKRVQFYRLVILTQGHLPPMSNCWLRCTPLWNCRSGRQNHECQVFQGAIVLGGFAHKLGSPKAIYFPALEIIICCALTWGRWGDLVGRCAKNEKRRKWMCLIFWYPRCDWKLRR